MESVLLLETNIKILTFYFYNLYKVSQQIILNVILLKIIISGNIK